MRKKNFSKKKKKLIKKSLAQNWPDTLIENSVQLRQGPGYARGFQPFSSRETSGKVMIF